MADEVDFEPDYDDEQPMDDIDGAGEEPSGGEAPRSDRRAAASSLAAAAEASAKSTKSAASKARAKGRGHSNSTMEVEDRYEGRGGVFESVDAGVTGGPQRSVEGWIVLARNIHQEAQEDDIMDKFSEYGAVKNLHVNLDRRTGFVKGYALVEFEEKDEAESAIADLDDSDLLGQKLHVAWAFIKGKMMCNCKHAVN
ncbi:unnamed protein product [Choristocarpus tenellus]